MSDDMDVRVQDSSTVPLLVNDPTLSIHRHDGSARHYRRRWLILAEFSLLAVVQGAVWNTWGSISSSAKVVFPGWTDATVALISNWGNICYLIFLLPMVWVIDTKGLRMATLLASALTCFGAGIRCFTMAPVTETWLIHLGHILNGVSGIVLFGGPPQVSAAWFPPHQRTTATGFMYVLGSIGVAIGSLFPPFLVDEINQSASESEKHNTAQQIVRLMYIQTIFAAVMFLWILIYFPPKPPIPPSISASVARVSFVNGLKLLSRNKNIWLVGVSYALSQAVYSSWVTVIHINLKVLGIDQKEAGWIGFYSVMGGCVGSLLSSRLVDYIGGKMKLFLFTGLIGSTLCFLYFLGICLSVFTMTRWGLYTSVILGGAFNNGLNPVFIELGAEVSYPISEGIVGGFLTGLFNVVGAIFLMLFFIPNIGFIWMNWCLIGSTIFAIPFLIFVNEHYARSIVDNQHAAFHSTSD